MASINFEAGMGKTMVVEGATDAEVLEAYIEHFLAPRLEEKGMWLCSTASGLLEESG